MVTNIGYKLSVIILFSNRIIKKTNHVYNMFQLITRDFLVDCFNYSMHFLFQFILFQFILFRKITKPTSLQWILKGVKKLDWIFVNW